MEKIDKSIAEIKRLQAENGHRTDVEKKAEKLICEGEHEEAVALLKSLDDSAVKK